MKRLLTTIGLLAVFVGVTAQAQPVRNGVDVVWARDVSDAELTLDGTLDEAAWDQAETIALQWNEMDQLPGSGQKIEGDAWIPAEPTDPNNGVLHILRNGNVLWLGLEVQDKSVGGGTSLWNFDGIIMSVSDRTRLPAEWGRNFFANGENQSEWIYGWFHPADTTAEGDVIAGIGPRAFGDYGVGFTDPMNTLTAADSAVWSHVTTVDGTANDDTHGEDVGYTMEMWINLDSLGYDMTQQGGDQLSFNIALQDMDYQWPRDDDTAFLSRVWFQNQWANNFNEGIAYIYGEPGVTISSGAAPDVTEPEFRVQDAGTAGAPEVDGVLDDAAWASADTIFQVQYQPPDEVLETLPGNTAYQLSFFRPDLNGGTEEDDPDVIEPSLGIVQMVVQDNILYVGLDVNDQAISGHASENGRDGLRLAIRGLDTLTTAGTLGSRRFEFAIDSTGAVRYDVDAAAFHNEDPTAVSAAVALKGASTAADPTDVDEGYTMEIAIDLTKTLGYPDGLGDGRFWVSTAFFDGDFLENNDLSYATRTWISGERGEAASIYGFLESSGSVANERPDELPGRIALEGNFPNPFNPTTTLKYTLPAAGDVKITLYDVLGREVKALTAGVQMTGANTFKVDASSLSSGVYFYRVHLTAAGKATSSVVGRMVLLK